MRLQHGGRDREMKSYLKLVSNRNMIGRKKRHAALESFLNSPRRRRPAVDGALAIVVKHRR